MLQNNAKYKRIRIFKAMQDVIYSICIRLLCYDIGQEDSGLVTIELTKCPLPVNDRTIYVYTIYPAGEQ